MQNIQNISYTYTQNPHCQHQPNDFRIDITHSVATEAIAIRLHYMCKCNRLSNLVVTKL